MPAFLLAPIILEGLGIAATGFALAATTFAIRLVTTFVVSSIIGQRNQQSGGGAAGAQLGNRVQLPPSTDNKIPVVYGSAFMKPIVIDAKISTDNQTMWYVLAYSEAMETDSVGTFSFGTILWADKTLNFDVTDRTRVVSWTDSSGVTSTKVDGNLFVWTYRDGSQKPLNSSDYAYSSAVMADTQIASGQRWDSTKKMNKLVFAVVKVKYNQEADLTGLGEITAEIKNTLSAPGSVIQDYLTNTRYGPALSTDSINTTAMSVLNSYSAELITYITTASTTATTSTFSINGPIDTSKNFLDNANQLVDACDSWLQWDEVKSQWSVVVNAPVSTATITTITSNNIIGGINIQPVDLNSTFNAIQVQYANSKARDQTGHWNLDITAFPNIERSPNEPDNTLSITLPLTNNIIQAQYIAARRLLQSREDLSISFTMDYSGIQINAGDVIGILHDRYGWDTETYGSQGKLWRVGQVQEAKDQAGTLYAKLTASEYNPTLYAKDLTVLQDFELSLNTGIQDPGVVAAPSKPTFSNVFTTTSVPSFDVSTQVPSLGGISAMEYWYGTTSTFSSANFSLYFTDIATSGFYTPGSTISTRFSGIPASTVYVATRSVGSRTKSSFSTVSNALIWNPLSTSGSATTSTYSTTATDAQNVRHGSITGSGIEYPIGLSTTTNFSQVNYHTGLTFNGNSGAATFPSGVKLNASSSYIEGNWGGEVTPVNRTIMKAGTANTATGVYVAPTGLGDGSSINFHTTSSVGQAQRFSVGITSAGAFLNVTRNFSSVPHANFGIVTGGANRLTITSSTGIVNILATAVSTSTTTGALIVSGGLGVGGNLVAPGQLHCEVSLSSNQSMTSASDTVIQFNRKNSDIQNWYSTSTYKITPLIPGYYLVNLQVIWRQGTGTGQNNVQIRKNGSTFAIGQNDLYVGTNGMTQNTFGIVQLNGSSDYIDVTGYNGGSLAQDIVGSTNGEWTKLSLLRLQ